MAPPGTRSEPQCAQPARTSTPRVFRSQTSLCRLASTLASESALCEPLHGRVCTRSSIYSIVILSVRVRPCGRHVYSTQCRHFATSHELWESGAYFHKVTIYVDSMREPREQRLFVRRRGQTTASHSLNHTSQSSGPLSHASSQFPTCPHTRLQIHSVSVLKSQDSIEGMHTGDRSCGMTA